jgi:glycosyltransferase involved in cell wall biosynthesis
VATERPSGNGASERAGASGEVLFFGTYDETLHPRIQVLREGLAAHGLAVTVLNEPLGIGTAQRVEMFQRPQRLVHFGLAMLRRWLRLVRRARRRPRAPDAVVVGYLGHFDVRLARLLFRRSTIVLAHLVGLSDPARDRRLDGRRVVSRVLERVDRTAQAAADVVLFDTDEHRRHLGEGVSDSMVVPVGAPTAYFDAAPGRSRPQDEVLRVLFFGLFTPLQGATTIGQAIALLRDEPGVQFTIVGAGQDHAAAQEAARISPHVTWIPWVDSADVPALVARHDVCLGIFGTTPKALRVVPNKVYQGLATGAAIITSDTPSQRRVLADAAVYVPPGDAEALARALRDLREDAAGLKDLQEEAAELARRRFTPREVTRELADQLRDRIAGRDASPVPSPTSGGG